MLQCLPQRFQCTLKRLNLLIYIGRQLHIIQHDLHFCMVLPGTPLKTKREEEGGGGGGEEAAEEENLYKLWPADKPGQ